MLACSIPHRPLPHHSSALQTSPPGLAPRKGSGARASRLVVAWDRDTAGGPMPLIPAAALRAACLFRTAPCHSQSPRRLRPRAARGCRARAARRGHGQDRNPTPGLHPVRFIHGLSSSYVKHCHMAAYTTVPIHGPVFNSSSLSLPLSLSVPSAASLSPR